MSATPIPPVPPAAPGGGEPSRPRHHRLLNRATGGVLVAFGLLVLAGLFVAPIPGFDELEARTGTVVEARRARFSPCRAGDCTRTVVAVRQGSEVREYHFGDTDPSRVEVGAPITVWTYPEIRGTARVRAWHAEQDGRVLLDHGPAAGSERTIRLWLGLFAPLGIIGGGWIALRYDWRGRQVRG